MPSWPDHLLHVLSAKGQISWSTFKRVFDEIWIRAARESQKSLDGAAIARSQTVRNLFALGHVDFDFKSPAAAVWASSPVLARLPFSGDVYAVLTGARPV